MDNRQKSLKGYLKYYKKRKENLSNLMDSFKVLIKELSPYPSDEYLCSKSKDFHSYLKEEEKGAQEGINRLEKELDKN